jgi:hypothetical protein
MAGDPTKFCANPHRAKIVRAIKRGELTIAQAARRYGVPQSGIVGWLKLAGVAIPPEYDRPRRQRSEQPLSRATIGQWKRSER